MIKEIFGTLAVILTFVMFVPYIVSILRNLIKPHLFTWVIWSIVTITVGIAQMYNGGGYGAISIVISGVLSLIVMFLVYIKKSDDSIKKIDYVFLYLSAFALLLWYLISNPLYTVVLLTFIDLCGYIPTMRKAYEKPHEEEISIFAISLFRNICSFVALNEYSIITTLFQIVTTVANLVIIGIIVVRRNLIKIYAN